MLTLNIPGREAMTIQNLVLDFNGTIASDGKILDGVSERLAQLSKFVEIYVITADTNGSVHKECASLPVSIHVIGKENQKTQKKSFVQSLRSEGSVSLGNGVNDEEMFAVSNLSIAVIGSEGCSTTSLLQSDIIVSSIVDGLDLLLHENRLIATLRN